MFISNIPSNIEIQAVTHDDYNFVYLLGVGDGLLPSVVIYKV